VSKRRQCAYSSGRSLHWITSKNPQAPAVNKDDEDEEEDDNEENPEPAVIREPDEDE
jgi:hypothetical protein